MKKIIIILIPLLASCVSLEDKSAIVKEVRVLGLDASAPIPYSNGETLINIRLGWIESKFVYTKGLDVKSSAEHKDINLYMGTGTIKRELNIKAAD